MSDLISRQAAIDNLERYRELFSWDDGDRERAILSRVIKELQSMPSAEPEIIRCKDCKWFGRVDKRRFYRGMDCLQRRIDTIVPDKDFCSRAERRTDG